MYIFIALYTLALLGLSFFLSKGKTTDDFLVAGRSNSSFKILASKFAGSVGVSTFITYTGFAYKFGFGVFSLLIGAVFGYSLFAFWAAPKINALSSQYNFSSQGDLSRLATGSEQAFKITNWITVGVQFFWVLLSLVGGAKVISLFGLMSYPLAVITTAAIILVYILLSGLQSVIITDIIQAVIILIFLLLIVNNLIDSPSKITILEELEVEKIKGGKIIGLLLYGGLSVFGMADRYQLCFAAKNKKAAILGMGLAIIPVLLVTFLLILIGLNVLNTQAGLDADMVFVHAMQNQVSTHLLPVLVLLFFAGLMSSADTSVFAVSSHVSAMIKSSNQIKTVRIATIIVLLLAVFIALIWKSIIDITIVGAAMRLVLAVPMIYIILQKKNAGRFIASSLGGVVGLAGGLIAFGTDPILAITTLVGTLLGLIYRSKTKQNE